MGKKVGSYRQRFGDSKQHYSFKRCEHNHTHVERGVGGRLLVCNSCNTIRDNELTAKLQKRQFRGDGREDLKIAA